MLPKPKPVPKVEVGPAIEEPNIEGVEPKADDDVVPPKAMDDKLEPNVEPVGAPNIGLVEEVEPKGLDEDVVNGELKIELEVEPNPDEPKLGGLSAKGFEGVVEEKGFVED